MRSEAQTPQQTERPALRHAQARSRFAVVEGLSANN